MKNRILILVYFQIMTGIVYGQAVPEDLQWLIRNGYGKNGGGAFNNNFELTFPTGAKIKIEGVAPPLVPMTPEGVNEYFAIYNNGDYSFIANNNQDPIFAQSYPIKYLYLTNKYEGDDIPENVKAKPVFSGGTGPQFSTSSQNWFYSHDILMGKDITFVLNPSYYASSSYTTVKLCYQNPYGGGIVTFNKSGFNQGDTKNQLLQSTMALTDAGFSSTNCITIPNTPGYVYLNFRPDYNEAAIGKSINFILKKDSDQNNDIELGTVPVSSKFHDPNYVELKCVWIENGKKYARYHVECYNDGIGEVTNLEIKLNLPIKAKISGNPSPGNAKVTINNWNAGNNFGCETSDKLVKTVEGRELTVNFVPCNITPTPTSPCPTILAGLLPATIPNQSHKAWF